jgi:photosystem II stability/assembly factor-like uncharacterized protein
MDRRSKRVATRQILCRMALYPSLAIVAVVATGCSVQQPQPRSWTASQSFPNFTGRSVWVQPQSNRVFAVGGSAIITSADGGMSWRQVAIPSAPGDRGCCFSSVWADEKTVLVGWDVGPAVLLSIDSGATWKWSAFPIPATALTGVNAVCGLPNGDLVAAGTQIDAGIRGIVARSQDQGASWDVNILPDSKAVSAVACTKSQGVFAVVDNGLRNSLDGISWNKAYTFPSAIVALGSRGTDLYAGTDSDLSRSTDSGRSWTAILTTNGASENGLSVSGEDLLVLGPSLDLPADVRVLEHKDSGWADVTPTIGPRGRSVAADSAGTFYVAGPQTVLTSHAQQP